MVKLGLELLHHLADQAASGRHRSAATALLDRAVSAADKDLSAVGGFVIVGDGDEAGEEAGAGGAGVGGGEAEELVEDGVERPGGGGRRSGAQEGESWKALAIEFR